MNAIIQTPGVDTETGVRLSYKLAEHGDNIVRTSRLGVAQKQAGLWGPYPWREIAEGNKNAY